MLFQLRLLLSVEWRKPADNEFGKMNKWSWCFPEGAKELYEKPH